MKKLIQVHYSLNKFMNITDGDKTYRIMTNYFLAEIIKFCKIPYYIKYLSKDRLTINIEEKLLIDIIRKYYTYDDNKNCYRVNLKKIYEENILKTIPYYHFHNLKYSKYKNNMYITIKNIITKIRKLKGSYDLVLYNISNKNNILIHVDDLFKFVLEDKIISYDNTDNNREVIYKFLNEYIVLQNLLNETIDNNGYENVTNRHRFYQYCFLNNIQIFHNRIMTDELDKIHSTMFIKILRLDTLSEKDISCIKEKKVINGSMIEHFENNSDCFVGTTFILYELMKINTKEHNVITLLRYMNNFILKNWHLFNNSNIFTFSDNTNNFIHKDDIYLVKEYIKGRL